MKTWEQAREVHRSRLNWCNTFFEVLEALDQAGAPPPDEVGAAHADWATRCGVLRVNMTLKSDVTLSGPRTLLDEVEKLGVPRGLGGPEHLADIATLWAYAIQTLYLPMPDSPVASSIAFDDHPPYDSDGRVAGEAARKRNDPYWDPAKGTQPSYDQLITDNRQLRAYVDELRTELGTLKNRIGFAAEGTK